MIDLLDVQASLVRHVTKVTEDDDSREDAREAVDARRCYAVAVMVTILCYSMRVVQNGLNARVI